MLFKALGDLHVHTCLSPCGDLLMRPREIAEAARRTGLGILGICDHNSAENVGAVQETAGRDLLVLPGMEVTTVEEVHLLALFENLESTLRLQEFVYSALEGTNNPERFGWQVVVDAQGEPVATVNKLLIGATSLTTSTVVKQIHRLNGLAIAAHVDRELYSLIGVLGFVPKDLALDALEVSAKANIDEVRNRIPDADRFPLVRSSDAHLPEDIGKGRTEFWVEHITFSELAKALGGREGRRAVVA
jgi:PHP family Zn ribbon phosphoesterase